MIRNKIHYNFWLITMAAFIISLVPLLIQDGMFFDGIMYSTLSKNLAYGYGSF